MGAGKLSLRRERRRRGAEANLRSLLHPALFSEARRDDRSENDLYDVCGQGPLKDQRSEIRASENARSIAAVATALRAVCTRLPFDKLRAGSETRLQLERVGV